MESQAEKDGSGRLYQLHLRKNRLLSGMLELTSKRAGISEVDRAEEILSLIEARQALMKKIDQIDAEIEGINRECGGTGEMIEELRLAGSRTVQEIQQLDREQLPRLELQFSKIKALQEKLGISRKTLDAYRKNSPHRESAFIDKKK